MNYQQYRNAVRKSTVRTAEQIADRMRNTDRPELWAIWTKGAGYVSHTAKTAPVAFRVLPQHMERDPDFMGFYVGDQNGIGYFLNGAQRAAA